MQKKLWNYPLTLSRIFCTSSIVFISLLSSSTQLETIIDTRTVKLCLTIIVFPVLHCSIVCNTYRPHTTLKNVKNMKSVSRATQSGGKIADFCLPMFWKKLLILWRTHFRSQNNWVWNFWSWTIEHKRQLATSTASIADNWFYETTKKTKKNALYRQEFDSFSTGPNSSLGRACGSN